MIGPGRVGGSIALASAAAGYSIASIVYRSRPPAAKLARLLPGRPRLERLDRVKKIDSEIVLITVSDDSITTVARLIAAAVAPSCNVFHTSGSISSDAIDFLRQRGAAVGSIHPLASISSAESGPERFRGAYFCVEGDDRAVRIGKRLVRAVGGRPFTIDPAKKALYHAAAVTAAGHVTALFDMAVSLMTDAGLDHKTSLTILRPLLAGATANLQQQDPMHALTGPFARADVSTFERQLRAMKGTVERSEMIIYLDLASRSLEIAEKNGASKTAIAKMREMISLAKGRTGC